MLNRTRLTLLVTILTLAVMQTTFASASSWKKLSPATSPSARSYAAMAYDPVSKKIVLFGGFSPDGWYKDTWTFDGTNWTQIKTELSPSRRAMAAMTFDPQSGRLVLFGGLDSRHLLHDSWAFDGANSTWTKLPMRPAPLGAAGPMLFNDPATGAAMMFGGFNVRQRVPNLHDTYRLVSNDWQKLHPDNFAIGRGWGVAITDPVHNNVVVTGGLGDTIRTDNTWLWDGQNWTQVFPATQVQSLVGGGSVFDPDLNLGIAFGGFGVGAGRDVNETWSWDGTNWVQLQPSKSPSAREGVGMAYDPVHHQIILFGGENGDTQHLIGDTWVFTGQ